MIKTKSKVELRYSKAVLLVNLFVSIFLFILVFVFFAKVSYDVVSSQDFQYNMISMSATLAGFLFTGLSVLISVIDKKNIKPYWEGNYFTILTKTASIGIILYIVLLVLSMLILVFELYSLASCFFVKLQLITLCLATVNFVWCIRELFFLVKELKES